MKASGDKKAAKQAEKELSKADAYNKDNQCRSRGEQKWYEYSVPPHLVSNGASLLLILDD